MKKSKAATAEVSLLPACAGQLSDRMQLAKLVLCLQVALSTLFGYLYTAQAFSQQALWVSLAVLVLACGAASLNSYQERCRDALMQRTRNRPLVRKRLSPQHALIQAFFLIALGLFLLLQFANAKALLAGIAAVLLYNVVYTNMKGVTLYALFPGALCGALPPYIGALAAESDGTFLRTLLPALLLFFWQVPHFFLVLLNHKQDYTSGAVPNLLQRLSEPALQRVFLPWIAALATIMLLFTVMPSSLDGLARSLIVMNAIALLGVFGFQLIYRKEPAYGFLFRYLNISLFFMMLVGCTRAF